MRKMSLLTLLITATMFNIFGQGKEKTEKEFNKIKTKIFPVIKVETSGESGKAIEFTADNQPIFKKVAGDLLCFYGIDKGDNFVLLTKSQIPSTVSTEDLDNISRENLLSEVQKNLKIHKTDFAGLGFTCGGNHEAALILLPEIWGVLTEKLGENIVFGVPAKDMSIYVNGDQKDSVSKLQEMITDIHKDGSRLLSKKLFKYKDGQIEVF
jgi:uncharacterized protein YtpQ (UPF0354 family)